MSQIKVKAQSEPLGIDTVIVLDIDLPTSMGGLDLDVRTKLAEEHPGLSEDEIDSIELHLLSVE